MRLSLVIPVHDDAEGLAQLLRQAAALGCVDQAVVVDDASEPPVVLPEVGVETILLRVPQQRGAGHARNLGLAHVTGTHVLFFDADDRLTPELPGLLAALSGQDFDFALFRHADSMVEAGGGFGPAGFDERHWHAAGATARLGRLEGAQVAQMAGIAAYPWNKIYRKGFLRDHGIRCTETPVHNDIELHWMSFLHARDIRYARAVCAVHVIAPTGTRLTNRSGHERFAVFDALAPVLAGFAQALPGEPARLRPLLVVFADFMLGLFDWITEVIAPALRPEFAARARAFLRGLPVPLYRLLALDDPALADRINARLRPEALPA